MTFVSAAGLAPSGQPVRARLIVNPTAGPSLWPGAQPAAEHLLAAGWLVEVVQTEYTGHATALAEAAVRDGYHIVVGCGGDGTLNEILQALVGHPTALGIIPMGTANVLARELGIPFDPLGAAMALLNGRVAVVDVGRAGQRAFLMMAGIGLDADVVHELQTSQPRPPRWLKAPLLFLGTFRRFFTYPGQSMRLTLDGRTESGRVVMAVIGNIRGYAGIFQIAHEADWSDGTLDLVVFYHTGLWVKIGNFISMLFRRHKNRQGVSYRRAQRVEIWTPNPTPVQADGELVGATPMTFSVEPLALRIVRP